MNVDANKVIEHLLNEVKQSKKTIAFLLAENEELKAKESESDED